jgi:hypothetical protein
MKTEMTITFKRDVAPRERDFLVLINGEHRATFCSNMRYSRVGYTFVGADGKNININRRRYWPFPITKDEFAKVVHTALSDSAIPTVAQIERVRMIEQAERENEERTNQISQRRAQVRREVLCAALQGYLATVAPDSEHGQMAAAMLKGAGGPLPLAAA